MAGASPRKAKRSPRQSPRVRAKAGSPSVRAKAPHESVIPASVFWSGAETAKAKATVSASSSTLGLDARNTGAIWCPPEGLEEGPVPLATVDLWEAQGGASTTISTPRTLTPPRGQVRVPLQASEGDVEKVETSSEGSKELATASTLLAPGGSPAWSLSRQTWSPRVVSPVSRTPPSTWTMPSRQTWSPRVQGAGTMTSFPSNGPRVGEFEVAKAPTAPTASVAVLLSGTGVPARPLLPINRVEPPLAQPTASPRYCLRRDVASAFALSSGCSSVPTPMVRECQTPATMSPAVRHAQSLPGGATPERSSASRRSPRVETKPGLAGAAGDPGSAQAPQDTGIPASPFSAASGAFAGSVGAIRSPRIIPPGVGTGGTTPTCTTPVAPIGRNVNGDPEVKVPTALTAVPRMPMSWLPRDQRVEPPLAQPTASPRYCFRRDVASTMALGSGCASVPTPMTPITPMEREPPPAMANVAAAMSPAMRHARSLPGGTVSLTPRRQEGQKLSHMPSVIPWVPGLQEPVARKVEPAGPAREPMPKLSEILNADVSLRYHASGHTQVRKQRLAGRTGNMTEDKEGYWEIAEGGGKQEFIYTV